MICAWMLEMAFQAAALPLAVAPVPYVDSNG